MRQSPRESLRRLDLQKAGAPRPEQVDGSLATYVEQLPAPTPLSPPWSLETEQLTPRPNGYRNAQLHWCETEQLGGSDAMRKRPETQQPDKDCLLDRPRSLRRLHSFRSTGHTFPIHRRGHPRDNSPQELPWRQQLGPQRAQSASAIAPSFSSTIRSPPATWGCHRVPEEGLEPPTRGLCFRWSASGTNVFGTSLSHRRSDRAVPARPCPVAGAVRLRPGITC